MRNPAAIREERRRWDRQIARLAVPAFVALVAEPLFLAGDAAIVGHLGTRQLAALGLAGTALTTVVAACVFLAYGTTARVARLTGAGQHRAALSEGVDGVWLAVLIGLVVTAATVLGAETIIGWFGPGPALADDATGYLRIAALGVVPLLVMLATTGVLRGLADTRTPVVVAVAGNLLNLTLNGLLVYPAGLGLAGSAIGSVLAQLASAAALVAVVARGCRSEGVSWRPRPRGIVAVGRAGVPLVLRTLTLRAALVVTTIAATLTAGPHPLDVQLATHQILTTVWTFLAFSFDALAIAAQTLIGSSLGAGDVARTRAILRRLSAWAVGLGIAGGAAITAGSPLIGRLFTEDDAVRAHLVPLLIVLALAQPLAAAVYLLDGVLIGAGDGRYLAWGGLIVLVVYAPIALVAADRHGLMGLWITYGLVFMGARYVVLHLRARSGRWLITGLGAPL